MTKIKMFQTKEQLNIEKEKRIDNNYSNADAEIARMNLKINNGHKMTENEAMEILQTIVNSSKE